MPEVSGKKVKAAQAARNNIIYAHPLPIIFTESTGSYSWLTSLVPSILNRPKIINPRCKGVLDVATSSVWILDSNEAMIFWRRGFFGKGTLSRSEPSWLARQVNLLNLQGTGTLTSEEVTAKRRAERRKFKAERAQAMAEAAAQAEAAFEIARGNTLPLPNPQIPTATTAVASLLPQSELAPGTEVANESSSTATVQEPPEDLEHLQLTLSEAFFLAWGLGCLTIIESDTGQILALPKVWSAFLTPLGSAEPIYRWDNPFLVHYVLYHHFRSLGWVVKGGIKFCVDYLLYKRGPVFSHAEFAVVLCPVYEDPEDVKASPFHLANVQPFTWSWLNTLNRVNSQVKKTLILVYVTIPASGRLSASILQSPACLQHYAVRQVALRRFVPARMRD